MSDYNDFEDENDEFETPQPPKKNGLRSQLEEALAELKEAKERNAALEAKVHEVTVKEVLAARGVPAKIAKFIPAGSDEAAVDAWLEENGDLFGLQPVAPAASQEDPEPAAAATAPASVDAELVKKWQALASTPNAPTVANERSQAIGGAKSMAELNQAFAKFKPGS